LSFFRRKGYITAGQSESHYKPDVNEVMLYKLFYSREDEDRCDRNNISVVSFEEKHRESVYRLILESTLPVYFRGVDRHWVDALFDGYSRRETSEVNQKFKLIFVAVDKIRGVVGVAGVTPKKGEPIKIMPCATSDSQAFSALIADLPQHLRSYGRKLYIHIVPSVEETITLQRLGWSLDAVMPGAYHENYCTQQWGNNLEDHTVRTMRVKNRFFEHIFSERKSLEIRVAYPNMKTIRAGENIQLLTGSAAGVIRVRAVRNYGNFESMLSAEAADRIVPDMNQAQVLALLRDIYPPEKERLGVVVLDIEPVH
jgi:ASC-1-like (ASCH) protein